MWDSCDERTCGRWWRMVEPNDPAAHWLPGSWRRRSRPAERRRIQKHDRLLLCREAIVVRTADSEYARPRQDGRLAADRAARAGRYRDRAALCAEDEQGPDTQAQQLFRPVSSQGR